MGSSFKDLRSAAGASSVCLRNRTGWCSAPPLPLCCFSLKKHNSVSIHSSIELWRMCGLRVRLACARGSTHSSFK